MGFRKKMRNALHMSGASGESIQHFFRVADSFTADLVHVPFDTPAQVVEVFGNMLDLQIQEVLRGR
jgi:hypothetical protein